MKKYVAVLAATAVLGVTSAFAAHPFSDVTAQDWAYQAVERLAAEGVIEGYPDGTFKGQRNITRYEMAQMIARADAHKDEVTAEQKATIQRLATEFANELQAFGVRVNKLEDQVGNFKFSGDLRVRYDNNIGEGKDVVTTEGQSAFRYRARLQFDAAVDDKTSATVRLSTGDTQFNEDGQSPTSVDQLSLTYKVNDAITANVGRENYIIGNGLIYDERFDGVVAQLGTRKLKAKLAYGYIVDNDKKEVNIYELNYLPSEHISVKGFYLDRHGSKAVYGGGVKRTTDVFGGAVDFHLGTDNKIWIGGEYARKERQGANGESWIAGIGYGKADITKPGTWSIKTQYFNFKRDTFVKYTTYNTTRSYFHYSNGYANARGWLVTADYTLRKNLGLTAYATMNSNRIVTEKSDEKIKLPEFYRVDLNYQF